MAIVRELTLPMALELAGNLGVRDRMEILRMYPDLDRWALERCTLPGNAWALIEDGRVVVAGGIVDQGTKGTLWLAGRTGWRRSVKHAVRIWRAIRESGLYQRFECQCAADNLAGQRFAEHLGFQREGTRNGLIDFGMAA